VPGWISDILVNWNWNKYYSWKWNRSGNLLKKTK